MINSNAFDYINVVDRALDASYLRETVIANNIANVDTPYYKRKDVNFQDVLDDAIDSAKYKTIDQAVTSINTDDLNPIEYTDAENFSYRIDRNNVDIDTENAELASEQLRYQALIQSANLDFSRFRSVIK
ncbi:MAG: flagellar basal body rod protein FlgB [Lachnospiraceae bacterium]|nr:flagellar basal body rod protein FlgB [Lachnospiraceae bacterium]MCI7329127.1 flagellar basal body rod protein FlgB [Lachnospiraceae bacterium]MDD7702262.1 flagellar basal body rod protein FlgB [Lachnospiraceae bacterium]MDY3301419.1 flagellar basal body rod protein FlgB [Lachnospiraceae bacterium]MEE3379416.1 flagellar basal body rod protein FlgB [Lachnospiraceae bacterium]